MIKLFNEEPLLKKVLLYITICFLISGSFINIIHIKQLNSIYKDQMALTQRVVGELLKTYPGEEVNIAKSLKTYDKSSEIIGEKFFSKYGYKKITIFQDDNLKSYAYKSILLFFLIILITIILNISILIKIFNKIIFNVINISTCIVNFIDNNYTSNDYSNDEGIFARIFSELNILGKKLEYEVSKLQCEKENLKSLVTDISHQLKTPLSSIKLYNSILLQSDLSKEESNTFLIKNESSIEKLQNLIDALVNISRLESSMINIKQEYVSIKTTIVKAINSAYMKALDKNISIDLEEFADIKILHDPKWTEESIFNLLDNAIKYTPFGGNINISISSSINYLRIDIKDNGIGIKNDEINNLFKRFYRGSSSEVKNTDGSGVGLYLTRKILEQQGGSILAASNIDTGSTFSILLPQKVN